MSSAVFPEKQQLPALRRVWPESRVRHTLYRDGTRRGVCGQINYREKQPACVEQLLARHRWFPKALKLEITYLHLISISNNSELTAFTPRRLAALGAKERQWD